MNIILSKVWVLWQVFHYGVTSDYKYKIVKFYDK